MAAKDLTNVDVAVFALAQLDGATKKVHHEHVAAKAFELAPDKFGWILPEYREKQWPDKEAVRAALVNAGTKEYGRLVEGGYNKDPSKDGWRLTASGAEWIVTNEKRLLDGFCEKPAQIPRRQAQRFCKRLKNDPMFRRYRKIGEVESASQYDFTDLLVCSPDAPRETIQTKFERLVATALIVKDKDILSFLDACKIRFSDLLERERAKQT